MEGLTSKVLNILTLGEDGRKREERSQNSSIGKFGSIIRGISPKATIFITKTKILITIRLRILSALLNQSMEKGILQDYELQSIENFLLKSALDVLTLNGQIVQKENHVFRRLEDDLGLARNIETILALFVKSLSKAGLIVIRSTVLENVKNGIELDPTIEFVFGVENPLQLESLEPNAVLDHVDVKEAGVPVYDLQVSDSPEFFANGILVHNCPRPKGGGIFKIEYFNLRCKAAPYNSKRVIYIDRASSSDTGCFTAMVLMAKDMNGIYYIEYVIRGQWEPTTRNQKIKAEALRCRAKYGPRYEPEIWIEREGGASGRDAWLDVARVLEGFNVREHNIVGMGSKDVRAEPWSSMLAAKNVWLIEGEKSDWILPFVDEHLNFRPIPGKRVGGVVDQVDASSGAFAILAGITRSQGLRTYQLNQHKRGSIRIICCSRDELHSLLCEHPSLLLIITDPPIDNMQGEGNHPHSGVLNGLSGCQNGSSPLHVLDKCIESLTLEFADIDSREHQETWENEIPPWNKQAEKLIMLPEHGKRLWGLLTKQRNPRAEIWVICDDGKSSSGSQDRRALSISMAICDTMRLDKKATIWQPSNPEGTLEDQDPQNRHVYDSVKASRYLVMS
jgi:hypothetical protein